MKEEKILKAQTFLFIRMYFRSCSAPPPLET